MNIVLLMGMGALLIIIALVVWTWRGFSKSESVSSQDDWDDWYGV